MYSKPHARLGKHYYLSHTTCNTYLSLFHTPSHPLISTLFPYTTLFRSLRQVEPAGVARSSRRYCARLFRVDGCPRSEEHTSELQSLRHLVCRLLLEKKKI